MMMMMHSKKRFVPPCSLLVIMLLFLITTTPSEAAIRGATSKNNMEELSDADAEEASSTTIRNLQTIVAKDKVGARGGAGQEIRGGAAGRAGPEIGTRAMRPALQFTPGITFGSLCPNEGFVGLLPDDAIPCTEGGTECSGVVRANGATSCCLFPSCICSTDAYDLGFCY